MRIIGWQILSRKESIDLCETLAEARALRMEVSKLVEKLSPKPDLTHDQVVTMVKRVWNVSEPLGKAPPTKAKKKRDLSTQEGVNDYIYSISPLGSLPKKAKKGRK